jgi:hypothetical protein
MKVLTTTELKSNFNKIIDRVVTGEVFLIQHSNSNFMLMPYQICQEVDELTRIYTEHEEGC